MDEAISNELMVTLIDAERAVHDTMPTSLADVLLAALTAEPETLEEVEMAIGRYYQPALKSGFLLRLKSGVNESKWDAGVLIIDLPARLIVTETEPTLYEVAPLGFAAFCPDPSLEVSPTAEAEALGIRYRLSEDWQIVHSLANWGTCAAQRRVERAAHPPFDARPFLFDPLPEFIARACLDARTAGQENPVSEIHERWLLTPRAELRGQSPRDVLLARREFVEYDLDSRAMQWAFTGVCPPGLSLTSKAYRCAAFGTHSNVVYFDLVRHLLHECWERVSTGQPVQLSAETARLQQLQREWLAEGGDYHRSPGWILEQERRRLPLTLTSAEALLEHDCPMCQLHADPELGPGFWHLDGSSMEVEDNWVFSFHPTLESWEAERRKWEEFNRQFAQEQAQRQAEIEWAAGEPIHDDRKSPADDETDEIPF